MHCAQWQRFALGFCFMCIYVV